MSLKNMTAFLEKLPVKNIYSVLKSNKINIWIYTFSDALNKHLLCSEAC